MHRLHRHTVGKKGPCATVTSACYHPPHPTRRSDSGPLQTPNPSAYQAATSGCTTSQLHPRDRRQDVGRLMAVLHGRKFDQKVSVVSPKRGIRSFGIEPLHDATAMDAGDHGNE